MGKGKVREARKMNIFLLEWYLGLSFSLSLVFRDDKVYVLPWAVSGSLDE